MQPPERIAGVGEIDVDVRVLLVAALVAGRAGSRQRRRSATKQEQSTIGTIGRLLRPANTVRLAAITMTNI
jgi:hypothetical protein